MDVADVKIFRDQGSADEVVAKGNESLRFLKFYKNKWLLVVCTIFSIAGGACPVVLTWFMAQGVTSFTNPSTPFIESMVDYIMIMFYFILGLMVVMGASYGFRGIAIPYCTHDIRCAIVHNLLKQEIEYFDSVSTGVLVSRISEDVTFALDTYIGKVQDFIFFNATIVTSIIFSFVACWRLALISLAAYPLCLLVYVIGEKSAQKLWIQFRDSSEIAASKAEEVITSFRTVKSFDNELYEAKIYNDNLENDHILICKTSRVQGFKNFFLELIIWGLIPVIMWYGAYILVNKPEYGLEFGNLFIIASCGLYSTIGVSNLFNILDNFKKANIAGAKILSLIEKKPKRDLSKGKTKNKKLNGKIEFRNVSFKYATRDAQVLNELSFTINQGETVAFVGESGCGKTTTLHLLQRFYEPTSGEILIDGIDIKKLSSKYLRSQISVVPQNPTLFSMSIIDNIRFSKVDATDEETMEAARIGNAHNFINELPDAYNTMVTQANLSGGQKQRVCLSRAILANAPILLLDEATASLDTESEQLVQQSLEEYRSGKTAIIVAHRLATVKNADKILVFKAGKIIESGKHEELLSKNSYYSDLIKHQLH
ncbi:ABC transporter family protein [Tritrichomonas foetus]|uniref:ABC transporter family protein n=1 Tax=Tritrichomonas foetus TaxID=1144522 RepID=A0A1J4KRA2_9EUKA|nr:ABC transporter family protein [Tritrichomonas foetus]|eukprot:OHT13464.1 ABC transporter family protein [Tritrichomonas foetus]